MLLSLISLYVICNCIIMLMLDVRLCFLSLISSGSMTAQEYYGMCNWRFVRTQSKVGGILLMARYDQVLQWYILVSWRLPRLLSRWNMWSPESMAYKVLLPHWTFSNRIFGLSFSQLQGMKLEYFCIMYYSRLFSVAYTSALAYTKVNFQYLKDQIKIFFIKLWHATMVNKMWSFSFEVSLSSVYKVLSTMLCDKQ